MGISTVAPANHFSGGVNTHSLSITNIGGISHALDTIKNSGLHLVESKELEQDPIAAWTKTREFVFDHVLKFGYSTSVAMAGSSIWMHYYGKVSSQTNLMELPDREFAFSTLQHRIESLLKRTPSLSTDDQINDCCSLNCPDIDQDKVHPREQETANSIYTTKKVPRFSREELANWIKKRFLAPEWEDVQEILRFRCNDPREKFLFISADFDHTGAAKPSLIAPVIAKLSHHFDLKYLVAKSYYEVCRAIERSKQIEDLAYVLIAGHGDPSGILFRAKKVFYNGEENWEIQDVMTENSNIVSCFSGVRPNGKIILLSCSTGQSQNDNPFNNIAQKIADKAKRVVIASKGDVAPSFTNLLSTEEAILYHPENRLYSYLPFYNSNLFTAFRPTFRKCSKVNETKVHSREVAAIETIRENLISKSLLHKDTSVDSSKEYLEFCEEDPRDKLLFLSARYDLYTENSDVENANSALSPTQNSKILSLFADKFDLRYKVVGSLNEICEEVNQASELGKVSILVIQGQGTPTEGMLLSKGIDGNENRISSSEKSYKCFSQIEEDGTIVFMGSSLGQNVTHIDSIAQKIANDARRVVLAATCRIYPKKTTIESIDPLLMNHPSHATITNFLFERCPENNENLFKMFKPQ